MTSVPPVFVAGPSGGVYDETRSGPPPVEDDGDADSEADAVGATDSEAEADGAADSEAEADGAADDGAADDGAVVGAVVGAALEGAALGAAAEGAGVVVVPEQAANAMVAHASRLNRRFCIQDPPRSSASDSHCHGTDSRGARLSGSPAICSQITADTGLRERRNHARYELRSTLPGTMETRPTCVK
jgi:hypothetical protein